MDEEVSCSLVAKQRCTAPIETSARAAIARHGLLRAGTTLATTAAAPAHAG